jgi:hypothetical protein
VIAFRLLSASVAATCVIGCGGDDMLRRLTPAEADARAREYIGLFTRSQVESATARLQPRLVTPEARVQLDKIATMLAGQHFDSSRVVGAQVNTVGGVRHTNLTYELHSPAGWFLSNVATVDSAGAWSVEGVSARPLVRTLEEEFRFSLRGKSPRHYAWLLVTVLCAATSLGTALFLASRRAMPKRWPWVLASLIGAGAFSLNWSTGAVAIRLLNLQLGAAGFVRSSSATPWILTFAVPVGAYLALERYRRWRRSPAASASR